MNEQWELNKLEGQAHTPNNQKKSWKICKTLEMKRKTWIVGHFTKVQFKENHLKGKVDNENKKFKKLHL